MPCQIYYSEAAQCVILEGHITRHYFDPAKPAEWEALIRSLRAEAAADGVVERIQGADLTKLEAQYRAIKAMEEASREGVVVKRYDERGKRKLSLEELGL